MFNYTVEVFPLKDPKGKMVAFANLIVDDILKIKGFKIFNGSNGLFVNPPSTQDKDDATKWHDNVLFFEDKEEGQRRGAREIEIYDQMIAAYRGDSSTNKRQDTAKAQDAANKKPPAGPKQPRW